jgi:hypothetical protein
MVETGRSSCTWLSRNRNWSTRKSRSPSSRSPTPDSPPHLAGRRLPPSAIRHPCPPVPPLPRWTPPPQPSVSATSPQLRLSSLAGYQPPPLPHRPAPPWVVVAMPASRMPRARPLPPPFRARALHRRVPQPPDPNPHSPHSENKNHFFLVQAAGGARRDAMLMIAAVGGVQW